MVLVARGSLCSDTCILANVWMVRAGRGGENVEDFIECGLVALGGARLGQVVPAPRREELLALYAEKYPEETEGSRAVWASQLLRFIGEGRKPGDRCLYVSTGSFTKEARYEAERTIVPTTLVDMQGLRRLLVDKYERMDSGTRALVPLKRLYWPLV
jgi:predicted Mrr-cat superfamily restriction endonuclease